MFRKILIFLLSIVLVSGCTSTTNNSNKTYDNEFITSLAKGLDNRWNDPKLNVESATNYENLLKHELKEVDGYQDKKFKNNKLKELAISYINELKNGVEITKEYGSSSWDTSWAEHQNKRTSILSDIQNIQEIPVKDTETLKELLAQGREVKSNSEKEEALNALISPIKFEIDQEKSNEYSTTYYSVVENTTDYNIEELYIQVTLKDSDDVNYYSTYITPKNWKKNTKTRLEFTDFERKAKSFELNIQSYSATKAE